MSMRLLSLALFSLLLAPATPAARTAPSSCAFHLVGGKWNGGCGRLFDQEPKMTLARAAAITSGRWKNEPPQQVWAGDMTDEGSPNAPIELELYDAHTGILRNIYTWLPVTGFEATANAITFQVDTMRLVAPSELDTRIVLRADAILSSVSAWNRSDNRQCPAGAKTWSIYCALQAAAIEVTGGFHHRRPALETVRLVVDERTAKRNYSHRLMDYNNDTTTHASDMHSLFAEALQRLANPVLTVAPKAPRIPPPPGVAKSDVATQLKIVRRAIAILDTPEKWNHADNGKCPGGATSWSLYCLLQKASIEIVGEFHDHNGATINDRTEPQMNEAYAAVSAITKKPYADYLIDFNNDPATNFALAQSLLKELERRLTSRLP